MAHRRDEFDDLHAGRRFVTGTKRVDDARLVGFVLQVRADADIALDIHHDEMLAVPYCAHADIGTRLGHAGRVDHHVDHAMRQGKVHVLRDGDPAGFHGGRHLIMTGNVLRVAFLAIGQLGARRSPASRALHHRADTYSLHLRHLGENVGSHFAGADEAYADRIARPGALAQFCCKTGQGDIGGRYKHRIPEFRRRRLRPASSPPSSPKLPRKQPWRQKSRTGGKCPPAGNGESDQRVVANVFKTDSDTRQRSSDLMSSTTSSRTSPCFSASMMFASRKPNLEPQSKVRP